MHIIPKTSLFFFTIFRWIIVYIYHLLVWFTNNHDSKHLLSDQVNLKVRGFERIIILRLPSIKPAAKIKRKHCWKRVKNPYTYPNAHKFTIRSIKVDTTLITIYENCKIELFGIYRWYLLLDFNFSLYTVVLKRI